MYLTFIFRIFIKQSYPSKQSCLFLRAGIINFRLKCKRRFRRIIMGKDYCSIKGCHNTTGIIGRFGKRVKLHHLPKKQPLKSAWLRAISRSNYKGGHFTYVCSDHFPHGDGRTWKHEVPTLFLPQKTEKTTKLRSTKNSTHSEMELESVEVDWCYFTIH